MSVVPREGGKKAVPAEGQKQRRYPLNPTLSLSLEIVFPARCHVRSHMTSSKHMIGYSDS